LEQAHKLREIRDPSPIIEFGLYRLLVAFVLDALVMADKRPEDPLDLKELIAAGKFDRDLLGRYASDCGEVFDLFHPEQPFLQFPLSKAKPKPLAAMYPVAPSGTNAGHWWHEHEDELGLTPAAAARLLTTIAPFMTAGGAGLSPSINGAPAIYALPMGSNLFETLILNLPTRLQESGKGVVAWRSTRSPGQERTEATTPEAMTWRPRAVQLIPEELEDQVIVRRTKFEKGDSTRLTWIDSNLAYRYESDKVTPVRMREGRPLWRDAGPLLLLQGRTLGSGEQKVAYQRPDVVQAAFEIMEGKGPVPIKAYGMRTDMKMKVFEWAEVGWRIPEVLGRSPRLGAIVHSELDLAERAVFGLRSALKVLYPRDGAGNKEALGCTTSRCERIFWQRLEREFTPLMSRFAELPEDAPDTPEIVKTARQPWREAIGTTAKEQFESAAKDFDADSDALERQVRARAKLTSALRTVLK
jgi:CRISPR system Cascade subunit CasA